MRKASAMSYIGNEAPIVGAFLFGRKWFPYPAVRMTGMLNLLTELWFCAIICAQFQKGKELRS